MALTIVDDERKPPKKKDLENALGRMNSRQYQLDDARQLSTAGVE